MRTVAIEELQATAARLPRGMTNAGRQYRDGSGRVCLVGAVLDRLGLPVPWLHEPANQASVASCTFRDWTAVRGYVLEPEAEVFALVVQQLADRGETWGEALSIAARVCAAERAGRRSAGGNAGGGARRRDEPSARVTVAA